MGHKYQINLISSFPGETLIETFYTFKFKFFNFNIKKAKK